MALFFTHHVSKRPATCHEHGKGERYGEHHGKCGKVVIAHSFIQANNGSKGKNFVVRTGTTPYRTHGKGHKGKCHEICQTVVVEFCTVSNCSYGHTKRVFFVSFHFATTKP